MALDMYVDPDYAELIIEVNDLKKDIAEKIVEKEWLSNYALPEIKHSYNLKLGKKEAELFLANINLEKLKRKIVLYKESLKYTNEKSEEKIDKIIDKEFKNQMHEYALMKNEIQEAIDYTHKEKLSKDFIDKMNYLYKELVIKLCPLINLKNTRLENGLFDVIATAYKEGDLNKLISTELLCRENNINLEPEIDDFENLQRLKDLYMKLYEENQYLVISIRSSEMFSNRSILDNEVLLRRRKDDINEKINQISLESEKLEKELYKLKSKK